MKKVVRALAMGYVMGFAGGAAAALMTSAWVARAVIEACAHHEVCKKGRITEVAEAVDVLDE